MKRGLLYSTLIHALLIALLLIRGGSGGKGGDTDKEQKGKMPGKSSEIDVQIIPAPQKSSEPIADVGNTKKDLKRRAPHSDDKCESFYGGVGIVTSIRPKSTYNGDFEYFVYEVYAGYPAANGGLKVGDTLYSVDDLRGEVGTPITIRASRDGQDFTIETHRDKICTEAVNTGEGT